MSTEDLNKMYDVCGYADIKLWCEGKSKEVGQKRRADNDDQPSSKREKTEDEERKIRETLEE